MYDIDVMWHIHIIHPKAYIKDMTKILGYVMTHDDTDQSREEGSKLNTVIIISTKQKQKYMCLMLHKRQCINQGSCLFVFSNAKFARTCYCIHPFRSMLQAHQQTAQLDEQTFGEDYAYPGCSYRGLPPKYFMLEEDDNQRVTVSTFPFVSTL